MYSYDIFGHFTTCKFFFPISECVFRRHPGAPTMVLLSTSEAGQESPKSTRTRSLGHAMNLNNSSTWRKAYSQSCIYLVICLLIKCRTDPVLNIPYHLSCPSTPFAQGEWQNWDLYSESEGSPELTPSSCQTPIVPASSFSGHLSQVVECMSTAT